MRSYSEKFRQNAFIKGEVGMLEASHLQDMQDIDMVIEKVKKETALNGILESSLMAIYKAKKRTKR